MIIDKLERMDHFTSQEKEIHFLMVSSLPLLKD